MELRNFSTGGFVLFARTFGKVFIKYFPQNHTPLKCVVVHLSLANPKSYASRALFDTEYPSYPFPIPLDLTYFTID